MCDAHYAALRVRPTLQSLCVQKMKRVVFSVGVLVIATILAYQLLGEIAVYYEMHSTGATSRAELADDFGLGLLGLFFVMPGSALIGFICSWFTWSTSKRTKGADVENT